MPTLPAELLPLIVDFAPLFSKPIWEHAKILIVGAILAIGKRTVTVFTMSPDGKRRKAVRKFAKTKS